jgi:cytochrome c peroxidase
VNVPLGLDADLHIPADNPMTAEKVELGRMLYFDKRLSADGTISCASCHNPMKGWTDQQPVSSGVHGGKGTRSAPTVINATYMKLQFWDGRARTLEEQSMGPIANPVEMGNSHEKMVATLAGLEGYKPLFEKAFHGPPTRERVAQAIASFERTVLSGNSAYDRYVNGDKSAMSAEATRGKDIFFGKGRCVTCHVPPTFSDSLFHNLGVGMARPRPDLGRYVVTRDEKDKGAFKTPSLRDVAHTAPYMHDGSQKTLEEVVEFYDKGGEANPHLDPLVTRLDLTAEEKADLVAFLEALDGDPTPTMEEPKLP